MSNRSSFTSEYIYSRDVFEKQLPKLVQQVKEHSDLPYVGISISEECYEGLRQQYEDEKQLHEFLKEHDCYIERIGDWVSLKPHEVGVIDIDNN